MPSRRLPMLLTIRRKGRRRLVIRKVARVRNRTDAARKSSRIKPRDTGGSPETASAQWIRLFKNYARKVERHRPVRQVDDFADAKIAADTAQEVRVDGGHAVLLNQLVDHRAN